MVAISRTIAWALLGVAATMSAAQAQTVNIPVDSANTAAWLRSDGGSGAEMVNGGPAVWNSRFVTTIPAGATGISFTLDTFGTDDKGVVRLNGTTIGDAVIFLSNGAAAGAGTFDFGLGGGNQAYTYVGFTPGAATSLPDGTTSFTLVVYMNDTNSGDPSAPPLPSTYISSFALSGTLRYSLPQAPVPTLSEWATILLGAILVVFALVRLRRTPN